MRQPSSIFVLSFDHQLYSRILITSKSVRKLNFKTENQITDKTEDTCIYIILDGMFAYTRFVLVKIYAPNYVNQQELQHQLKDYVVLIILSFTDS